MLPTPGVGVIILCMPKREPLVTEQIYHVLNKGVDGRNIFIEAGDYLNAIQGMKDFNFAISSTPGVAATPGVDAEKLVKILAFCLRPNHFHLLLQQVVDGGISTFMRRLGDGIAKHFNIKYQRKGSLFQGRFKSVLIDNEKYFLHIPYYIHMNAVDDLAPSWRQREISKPVDEIMAELAAHRWSSNRDYLGVKTYPDVIDSSFLLEFFGGYSGYRSSLISWLKGFDLEEFSNLVLE